MTTQDAPKCEHRATRCMECGHIHYRDPFDHLLSADQLKRKWQDEDIEKLIREMFKHEPRGDK